jgi:hypothetical protein
VDRLKNKFLVFKIDPALSISQGNHLFPLIDCLVEALGDIEDLEVNDFVQTLRPLLFASQEVVDILLEKINVAGENSSPNFEILENSLQLLLDKSAHYPEDRESFKKELLLSIWYTFRAVSEMSGKLAVILNRKLDPENSWYFSFMEMLIDMNYDILKRCVHKGAIEAASAALGKITKVVTAEGARTTLEPTEEDDLVGATIHLLMQKVDESRVIQDPDNCDFRSIRGQILILHHIVKNDETKNKKFVEAVMMKLLGDVKEEEKTNKIRFTKVTKPLHIHQLAALVKDSDLLEHVIPYWDKILSATFNAFKVRKILSKIQNLINEKI